MGPQEKTFCKDLGNIKKSILKYIQIPENTTGLRKPYDPKENACGLKEYQEVS